MENSKQITVIFFLTRLKLIEKRFMRKKIILNNQ